MVFQPRPGARSVSLPFETPSLCPGVGGSDVVMDVDVVRSSSSPSSSTQFKCGKCRRLLFLADHVYEHRRAIGGTGATCGFGLLIAPMKWMQLEKYEDKACILPPPLCVDSPPPFVDCLSGMRREVGRVCVGRSEMSRRGWQRL
jgi:hypothetical protein